MQSSPPNYNPKCPTLRPALPTWHLLLAPLVPTLRPALPTWHLLLTPLVPTLPPTLPTWHLLLAPLVADNCRDFAEKITGTCGLTHVRKNMMVGGISVLPAYCSLTMWGPSLETNTSSSTGSAGTNPASSSTNVAYSAGSAGTNPASSCWLRWYQP